MVREAAKDIFFSGPATKVFDKNKDKKNKFFFS